MKLLLGECLEELKKLDSESIDSLITDPPAGISFMGKDWDGDKGGRDQWISWMSDVMKECLRVMKPGAHGLVWALPRTSHWTATALENAGFEVRDVIVHLFGQGFPKSLDISKAIDKAAGAKREVVSTHRQPDIRNNRNADKNEDRIGSNRIDGEVQYQTIEVTAPATDAAKQWHGWGTALKPAAEHWILVRKPCSEKTVAANVLKHGTGGINIDGSRIDTRDSLNGGAYSPGERSRSESAWGGGVGGGVMRGVGRDFSQPTGRFPANVILDEEAGAALDEQSGILKQGVAGKKSRPFGNGEIYGKCAEFKPNGTETYASDKPSGASRFFYCAKISSSERNAGLDKFNRAEIDSSKWNVADTEAAVLLLRAILESMPSLSIVDAGDRITVTSPKDILSTTRTRISQITESRILNWLTLSHTSECTQDANSETGHGGSDAAFAKSLSELMNRIGTLPGKDGSLLVDAVPAIFQSLQKISNADEWKPLASTHPTVKSSKLMRYLCKLITPPNGVVLDPFMGSGSTGLAAISEGFQFIGIEREAEYLEIATKRISHVQKA